MAEDKIKFNGVVSWTVIIALIASLSGSGAMLYSHNVEITTLKQEIKTCKEWRDNHTKDSNCVYVDLATIKNDLKYITELLSELKDDRRREGK